MVRDATASRSGHQNDISTLYDPSTMTAKAIWTQETLEQTLWAQEFKKEAPVSYSTAIRYALEDRLEVFIDQTTESGEPQ